MLYVHTFAAASLTGGGATIARAFALSMNTWLFVCVSCLALTPLLAFAHIQNTAHRQTANRSGPLLPGLSCAPVVCLSPSSLRYRLQHKALPLFVSMHRWAWDVMSRKARRRHRSYSWGRLSMGGCDLAGPAWERRSPETASVAFDL